jgi:flagellar hook-associated protein 3 FlgL
MTTSISTFGLYNLLLGAAKNVQSDRATAVTQESTGLVGTDIAAYGKKMGQLLNLQDEINRAQKSADLARTTGDRAEAMYSAIGSMIDLMTNLRSAISGGLSGDDTTALVAQAQATLSDLAGQMNTQLGGRYLFAGSRTDGPAVDLSNYPSTLPPSATTPDGSYYQGDGDVASLRLPGGSTLNYGVTGDNPAFEQALRAASMVANVTTSPLDSDALKAAFDLADSAVTGLTGLQAQVSVAANRLDDTQQSQTAYVTLLQDAASSIKNVDAAEAMAKATELQTQLQAAYSALSMVMKIRLTDYL